MQNIKRILLVDDEEYIQITLQLFLEDKGFHVTVANCGNKAVEEAFKAFSEGHPYDLIISDIHMPDMTGDVLLQKIKRVNMKAPVLIMTGFGNAELNQKLDELGADGYLEKPFDPARLLKIIHNLLPMC